MQCLESAKANDSIAYLRFWFRNPLEDENRSRDASMADAHSSDDDEDDGGVRIARQEGSPDMCRRSPDPAGPGADEVSTTYMAGSEEHHEATSRSSSGISTDLEHTASDTIFDAPIHQGSHSSASSVEPANEAIANADPVEVEAVVSCTSDGLVVVIRRARPLVPQAVGATEPVNYTNGLFASPWALDPVVPAGMPEDAVPKAAVPPGTESDPAGFMTAIRDVAVFAWSLAGINGTLTDLSRGQPSGESQPPGGLPIWDPSSNADPENLYNGFSGGTHRPITDEQLLSGFSEITIPASKQSLPNKAGQRSDHTTDESSSEDEILWKRAPTMPEFRRPPRRAHREAFGEDATIKEEEEERADSVRRRRTDP